MRQEIELGIEGMHCAHCEVTVGDALTRAGLSEVSVDWRRGTATGMPTPAFSRDAAVDEVSAIGYQVADETKTESQSTTPAPEYDLVVIGSGSAAFAAAIKARDLGASVALIERDTVGGTCVNVGCVPSKAVLRAAEAYWRAGHSPFAGAETSAGTVDLKAVLRQKDEVVAMMRKEKYEDLLDHYDIDLITGSAQFIDRATVDVDGRAVTARRVLIATGAVPWVPPIDGFAGAGFLTSTTALELDALPQDLIVVGANAIGLELGQLFLHLGSRVTFVEALDRVAPFEEPEISAAITERLEATGGTMLTGAKARTAGTDGDKKWLEVEVGGGTRRLSADHVVIATGRRARTEGLGLDSASIEIDTRGHVVVDASLKTTNDSVYAAGDVTNHPQFVYVAALGGSIAAENALRGTSRKIDFTTMPRVTFTTPQIASVGLTEAEARDAGKKVITSVLPLGTVPRAIVDHDTDGLVKLVADETSGHLLGAHMIGDGSGDVIQAAVMAIKYRATIDEIAETYHPYLTMAEALKLAAQSFNKDVSLLSCCAA